MSLDEQSKAQLPVASASTALLTAADIIAPIDIDKAAEAFRKFDQFKKRILNANDVVDIQGKLYLKRREFRLRDEMKKTAFTIASSGKHSTNPPDGAVSVPASYLQRRRRTGLTRSTTSGRQHVLGHATERSVV